MYPDFDEGAGVSMTFPASSICFGQLKVEPVGDVELSSTELRILFRTRGSSSEPVTLAANPFNFVKTIYAFDEVSTRILFRPNSNQLECINSEINRLPNSPAEDSESGKSSYWIVIKTGDFDETQKLRFKEIVSCAIGCDEIESHEMDKFLEFIANGEKQVMKIVKQNLSKGDDDVAAQEKHNGATNTLSSCIIEYPLHERGATSVTVDSYKCLEIDEYLDDAITDFYANYLRLEQLSTEQRQRTHIFSVFFYTVLTSRSPRGAHSKLDLTKEQKRHENVAKWTKDVNIFEKDFVLVPINSKNHWFLAIICFPSLDGPVFMDTNEPVPIRKRTSKSEPKNSRPIKRPCILIFDSLGSERNTAVQVLRDYLTCEYEAKMNGRRVFDENNMPGQVVNSPHQPNLNDCGLFVLQNMEQFFKDPIESFELPIKDLEQWYDCDVAVRKRRDIAELIQRLMETHSTGFNVQDLPKIELPE